MGAWPGTNATSSSPSLKLATPCSRMNRTICCASSTVILGVLHLSVLDCSRCGETKPAREFHKNKRQSRGRSYWCKSCASCHAAAASKERKSEHMAMRKAAYWNLKRSPCADCGQRFHPVCMDFDHRPDEEKLGGISVMVYGCLERLVTELAKCDLVCSNCHRMRTYGRESEKC